jgi:hypothetical protein
MPVGVALTLAVAAVASAGYGRGNHALLQRNPQVVQGLAHLLGDIARRNHSPLIIERARTSGEDQARPRRGCGEAYGAPGKSCVLRTSSADMTKSLASSAGRHGVHPASVNRTIVL